MNEENTPQTPGSEPASQAPQRPSERTLDFAEVISALEPGAGEVMFDDHRRYAPLERAALEDDGPLELEDEANRPENHATDQGELGDAHEAPAETPQREKPKRSRLVLVTGRAGAGRTTAINALEDLGFERVDTPPLGFIPAIIRRLTEGAPRDVAIGVSARTVDFTVENFLAMRETLENLPELDVSIVFLDGADEALRRRYSETRRRHPLSPEGGVEEGLAEDRRLVLPLRARADVVIDTSSLTPADLRRALHKHLAQSKLLGPTLSIMSFAYKNGLPVDADMIYDCRFLRNPHYDPQLRDLDGRDQSVRNYVAHDERFSKFLALIEDQAALLLPAFAAEGKSYVTIAFGCTGGKHRSVTLAETFRDIAEGLGWRPAIRHRELDRESEAGANP